MKSKLLLTIAQQVIHTAKKYAYKKEWSLSDLGENYLRTLSSGENQTEEISPRVKRLVGGIELPDDFDYKDSLREAIFIKHSKRDIFSR